MFQPELFNSEPTARAVKDRRLLVIACSGSKKDSAELMPAIDRYDGPMWKVLRSFTQGKLMSEIEMDIYALSAEYGLIPATQPIPWYDRIMTEERAKELHNRALGELSYLLGKNYSQVCFALSQLYLLALHGWENAIPQGLTVTITDGPMATKLGQLRSWLRGESWRSQEYSSDYLLSAKIKSEVVLKGVILRFTREEVLQRARLALAASTPGADGYKDWCVKIDGQAVAPKWLVSQISGIPVRDFDAKEARRVLLGLGIDIERAR